MKKGYAGPPTLQMQESAEQHFEQATQIIKNVIDQAVIDLAVLNFHFYNDILRLAEEAKLEEQSFSNWQDDDVEVTQNTTKVTNEKSQEITTTEVEEQKEKMDNGFHKFSFNNSVNQTEMDESNPFFQQMVVEGGNTVEESGRVGSV